MGENLYIPEEVSKEELYKSLYPQLKALVADESDLIANMANITSALKEAFDFFWIGFYRVIGDRLVLGPFQGPIACTSIAFGKGVCGSTWKEAKTIIVPDVDRFPGHIACSSQSRSEIVVPLKHNDIVVAVLDVDSNQLNSFDEIDSYWLEKICALL
ncbi:MAG TPA: GAF domain-containing protein [Bacteroidales bacterium]|nr:GAF domain-containing protein [Bacteroidales bacterium]